MTNKKMHLVAYLKTGPTALHSGGWRHPEATLDDILDPARYEDIARHLEQAKFDGAFFADAFGIPQPKGLSHDYYLTVGGQHSYLDPMLVLPIMARVTRHLGLGATVSTSFFSAYQLARSLATADALSGGRIAWNVVTSTSDGEFANAGLDAVPPSEERYDRAEEIVEACMALWNGWEPDSFVLDKAAGILVDATKVHPANYEGRWTKTRGPIATPPSPQGHPVIMQAGSSPRGRDFAARWAELVFSTESRPEQMRAFREDMNERLAKFGRAPDDCKILPGLTIILGETDSIAKERAEYLDSLIAMEYDITSSSLQVGADLTKLKSMQELAAVRGNNGIQGISDAVADVAEREKLTPHEAAAYRRRATNALVGSPQTVADVMEEKFKSGGCDGFVLMPATHPTSHEQFCRAVVPELQRRGLFRTEYAATTLRGNLKAA